MTLPPRQAVNILNIRAAKNEKPDTAIPIFKKNELPTLININFTLRAPCFGPASRAGTINYHI